MDHSQPKTRMEAKGRDKKGKGTPYSQKHVRAAEALLAKQRPQQPPSQPASKPASKR